MDIETNVQANSCSFSSLTGLHPSDEVDVSISVSDTDVSLLLEAMLLSDTPSIKSDRIPQMQQNCFRRLQ